MWRGGGSGEGGLYMFEDYKYLKYEKKLEKISL